MSRNGRSPTRWQWSGDEASQTVTVTTDKSRRRILSAYDNSTVLVRLQAGRYDATLAARGLAAALHDELVDLQKQYPGAANLVAPARALYDLLAPERGGLA